ncbi:MAG TPA: 23S rRNA (pseudouridine(1915)-N(3))-methyltransferase RlmH [Alphaproteobacteria bacterium]|nr:23S rRNA (pseudouridine(1915)-N(3))-methyltransferase RlmH [Alphaproteobacteria bacterium]
MRIVLAAVGRLRSGPERALYEHYVARLTWPVVLKEVELKAVRPKAQQKAREAALLLAALPEDATVVALDATGRLLTSEDFAARLGAWRDEGVATIAFVIGGADGLDDIIRRRARLVLALGRVTWPHFLMRGLLAEQLYRAQQILAGHPYHRG